MSEMAIRVKDLSKLYRIGAQVQSYETIRESLANAFASVRSNYTTGSANNRTGTIWALDGLSFDVDRGEVLGVIGRNGAGKSTLLKILSRITRPTGGEVRLRGRVGSLLEVGTGFHPELTGRENIYLNGAILGMRQVEINSKFDEIVEFAEIGQFLDTPVKRYSSGMYMRLAFSVAAHLEPEILLVDEVLAVGDAAFQKKCLGRMGQVAGEGRTVLFVSHNMGAIRSLCPRSILIERGKIEADGSSDQVISQYLKHNEPLDSHSGEIHWLNADQAPGSPNLRLRSIRLVSADGRVQDQFDVNEPIGIEFVYQILEPIRGMRMVLVVTTMEGIMVFASTDHTVRPYETHPGTYCSRVKIPPGLLNRTRYTIQVHAGIPGINVLLKGEDYLAFTCVGDTSHGSYFPEDWPGTIAPKLDWESERLE